MSDLATVALKHIKIMSRAYALPPKLSTLLLLEVCKSLREIFNCNILNHYADANADATAMETRYTLQYSTLSTANPDYSPIDLQGEYSKLSKNGS